MGSGEDADVARLHDDGALNKVELGRTECADWRQQDVVGWQSLMLQDVCWHTNCLLANLEGEIYALISSASRSSQNASDLAVTDLTAML